MGASADLALDQVHGVIARARSQMQHLLGDWTATGALSPLPAYRDVAGTDFARTCRGHAADAFGHLDVAQKAATAAIAGAHAAYGQAMYVPDVRVANAQAVITEARSVVDDRLAAAERSIATIVTAAKRVSLPTRGPGDAALQEAQLANIRSDVRMVLDAMPAAQVRNELVKELERRVAVGDTLGVWLLAGDSGWTESYLRSRGLDEHVFEWQVKAAQVLAPDGDDDGKLARRILSVVDTPRGLAGAVAAMRHITAGLLDVAASETASAKFLGGHTGPAS